MVSLAMHVTDPARVKALELALDWHKARIAQGLEDDTPFNKVTARKIADAAGVFHTFLKES